jgi:DNA invertase Pin-like site-specific DNA recombinase
VLSSIWTDTASGKLARRPEWDNCLDHLRRGDELAVTRLSRMARSVRHLTEIAALLAERGIDLVVLKQGIDTTTPAGRFTFHVLAAMDDMRRPHLRRHPRRPGIRPGPAAGSAAADPS